MENIDFEMLRKRREKVLKLRAETEKDENQHIGIAYELILDGRHYSVMACFPAGMDDEPADDKFKYLINGQKS